MGIGIRIDFFSVKEAKEYLQKNSSSQGFGYVDIRAEDQEAVLDGTFSLQELKALVVMLENKQNF